MKICYIINQYPKGSHSFIRREIVALERLGNQILRIACRGWRDPVTDTLDADELQRTYYTLRIGVIGLGLALIGCLCRHPVLFFRAQMQVWNLARGTGLRWWVHHVYFAEACAAASWIRRFGAEHIHAHFGTNSAEIALFASTLSEVPFSFTVHGPEEFDRPAALRLKEKIRSASRVVAVSSFGRSQLFRWADRADWRKVHVVHCGLDESFTQTPGLVQGHPDTLICVGRLCEQKGQLLLLDALHRVIAQGLECRIVLAGDGPMRGEIEQQALALGVADRVRITGWIDGARVRSEILGARALVLPSFAEGLPVVIMEAMALGRPVISTYIAGIPELVLPGASGWLVPAGDVEALALAMAECLTIDEAHLKVMGSNGRARVLQRHDVNSEASRLLQMFETAIREWRSGRNS